MAVYTGVYQSAAGEILLSCDEKGLTGLEFRREGSGSFHREGEREKEEHPVLGKTRQWLDLYFSGKDPGFVPPLHMTGSPFRMEVWKLLLAIPYGKTTTYGQLAKAVAEERGLERMSAQAIGGAVGHNKIWIIVPCHRVVGADGSLTGYAGGIDRKALLLKLEGWDGCCLDGKSDL